ncbi:MAG: glycosyltransferase family 2 protein [Kiritimatiellae bacterium]|nr:glycosyltransferase family 2 protein [Kiritimatiellia bacterium]MDD5520391.1 glycosyltransferase family 2 protein [Kiritimatiellia bacterium]
MTSVSVVVPVYNEAENVPILCEKLNEVLSKLNRSYEAVLIDDGSSDDSWEELLKCIRKYKHFRLIKFRRNFGQTAAMSAGFRESKGDIIITLDADLQNNPEDIPKILERMEQGFDVVSGWRKDRKDPFINRRLPSILANWLISTITGVPLHDYGCTLKGYRREIIKNLDLYGEMHRFIPALASWVGGTIDEIPVDHHPRRFGKSKYGISRTVRVVLDLITVKFLLKYSTRPIQIFGKIGLSFGAIGTVLLLMMTVFHLLYKAGIGTEAMAKLIKSPFWVMTSFMLIFFGVQFLSMGLLAEIQIRTYHESQNKPIYVIKEIVEST